MKRLILSILPVFFLTSFSYSQYTSSSDSQTPSPPLEIAIKSDKKIYNVGEDINIELTISNKGEDSVQIYSPEFWGISSIIIKNSKGDSIEPQFATVLKRPRFERFVTIPPNETLSFSFNNLEWFGCSGLFTFNSEEDLPADTYSIYMTITNPPACAGADKYLKLGLSGSLVSDPITIEARE